ncbi:hypothetical protein J7E49_20165 [Variovorax paradoxus]|nr:hypothetical protein [Variovorax paradoxus]
MTLEGHDAEIISVNIDRENSVCRLGLSHEGEKQISIELFGVAAFRVEDFGLQNVVNRILRSTSKDFSEDELNYWLEWVTSLSDSSSWLKSEKKCEWLDAFNDGRLELIVLEPSAGAQIVAVCERVCRV